MSPSTSPPVLPLRAITPREAARRTIQPEVSLLDIRPWAVLAVSCAFVILVARHYDGLNGPNYWKWRWRNLETLHVVPMLGALLPFAVAQWAFARRHWPRWIVLLLIMLTTFALETVAASARPSSGAHPVAEAVWDPYITSYFTDASSFTTFTSWIQSYPQRMPSFHVHSLNKPPAAILFYVPFIRLFGNNLRAALVGGFVVGGLATLSVPAVYVLTRRLVRSVDVAFCSASFFALTPSLVLFMPEFDQVFPVLTCALIAAWASMLAFDRIVPAVIVGLLLAAITLVSYNLLVIGVFLALQTVINLMSGPRAAQCKRIVKHGFVAVLTFVAVQNVLVGILGYQPLGVYKTAVAIQAELVRRIPRPYPVTVLFDLTDFALGSGWIAVVLLVLFLIRQRDILETETALVVAALLQLVAVAVLGLLPGETARVWLFLLPLLMLPVGLELVHWTFAARAVVYGSLWLITFTIARNMALL